MFLESMLLMTSCLINHVFFAKGIGAIMGWNLGDLRRRKKSLGRGGGRRLLKVSEEEARRILLVTCLAPHSGMQFAAGRRERGLGKR